MADLYEYLTPQGIILPDTGDVQAAVEQEYRDALGQDLNVKQGPQQVLIAGEVTARQSVLRINAALANSINPDLAGGVFLDAIWKLTGGVRRAATKSALVGVELAGQAGTLVPAGSLAETPSGDRFATVADVTLDGTGAGVVDFLAVEYGAVPCPVGALTVIVSAVLGWETVTNPTGATVGLTSESDAASRLRRRVTLALQGVALPEAIISALYAVEGVKSLTFRENKTAATATIDGIAGIVAHSMWTCVAGGANADIAAVLLAKTSLGCNWNGSVTVAVVDAASGQSYNVKFERPTAVPVLAKVYVRATGVVGNPVTQVQDAIMQYVNGEMDGERGFVVGGAVSPFELAGAVSRTIPGMYVQKVEVTKAAVVSYQPAEIVLALNELATINESGINVTVL